VRPHLASAVDEDELLLLADAQTSGGLLVVGEVPGHPVVGQVVARTGAVVEVR
jgi:selenide,water dikinase